MPGPADKAEQSIGDVRPRLSTLVLRRTQETNHQLSGRTEVTNVWVTWGRKSEKHLRWDFGKRKQLSKDGQGHWLVQSHQTDTEVKAYGRRWQAANTALVVRKDFGFSSKCRKKPLRGGGSMVIPWSWRRIWVCADSEWKSGRRPEGWWGIWAKLLVTSRAPSQCLIPWVQAFGSTLKKNKTAANVFPDLICQLPPLGVDGWGRDKGEPRKPVCS